MESIRSTTSRPVLVGVERVRRDPEVLENYRSADPFPHTVITDVLTPLAFRTVGAEFPPIHDAGWHGYLHVNETKYANPDPDTWPTVLRELARELCSDDFVAFLGELTGIDNLIPDWSMDGGGLHQTLRGGHLNVHTDFTAHHVHTTWETADQHLVVPQRGVEAGVGRRARVVARRHVGPGPVRRTRRQHDARVHHER